MTPLEIRYPYKAAPSQSTLRALDSVREVYGIRRLSLNEQDKIVRVEFDASRMKEPVIAGLLRHAGLDLGEPLPIA
jgi:hypothetical protein